MLADTIIFLSVLKTTVAIFILDFLEVLLTLSYLCMSNFTFSFPQKAYAFRMFTAYHHSVQERSIIP